MPLVCEGFQICHAQVQRLRQAHLLQACSVTAGGSTEHSPHAEAVLAAACASVLAICMKLCIAQEALQLVHAAAATAAEQHLRHVDHGSRLSFYEAHTR